MRCTVRMLGLLLIASLAVPPTVGIAQPPSATGVTGAGSTFVFPLLARWVAAYAQHAGVQVSYQPVGTAAGMIQLRAGTVAFGASEAPQTPAQLDLEGLMQFPLLIGGVVPVVNIDGIGAGELRFTGSLLADIYLGKIQRWSDPAIAAINPGLKLPNRPIIVICRTDGSGTTFNWVDYLSRVSTDWKRKVGEGTSVAWPVGIGAMGNAGVADSVGRTKGAIGYVEYAYVLRHRMTYALVQNRAGNFVRPKAAFVRAAAATVDWSDSNDFDMTITDAPGADSYPISAFVFVLMPRHPKDPFAAAKALAFFRWVLESGQPLAEALEYVPLTPSVVHRVEAYWEVQVR
jgi:phosphate transport system substrate-binding protein